MTKEFIIFGQPLIEQDEIDEVVDSMERAWLGTGPKVHQFEKDFSNYKAVPNAVAVNSCTAALHLSCLALGLKTGDEVITTSMTFCATINAIIHSGATPVLADIDPVTLNISEEELLKKISKKTRAILIVHFAGRPCNMTSIMAIAEKHNLKIIEDCAHAIESQYNGKNIGTFGDLGCFSFYATKNIVTGEGGMVIGEDETLLSRIKTMALHGMSRDAWKRFSDEGYKHYYVVDMGFKYNMMDLQAAIGLHQLKRIDAYWGKRKKIWDLYTIELSGLPIVLPAPPEPNTKHAYHLYSIRINKNECGIDRDEFIKRMTDKKIGVGVHYLSIPEHPFYMDKYSWNVDDYPNSRDYGQETVSLPISPKLSEDDISRIISAVRDSIR